MYGEEADSREYLPDGGDPDPLVEEGYNLTRGDQPGAIERGRPGGSYDDSEKGWNGLENEKAVESFGELFKD